MFDLEAFPAGSTGGVLYIQNLKACTAVLERLKRQ